jgi:ferrous iron transport protein A
MTQPNLRLVDLETGESATIVEVEGEDVLSSRLMEMGLIEGESIAMIGRAPMGDPIEYSICGYRISLRRSESSRVIVRKAHHET